MTRLNPTHPGLSVLDSLEAVGWSVSEFADRLEISEDEVSQLLNCERGISPAMALALERLGWSNADFWMRRQAYYDLAQERRRQVKASANSNVSVFSLGPNSIDLEIKDDSVNHDKHLYLGDPFTSNPPLSAYLTQAMERAKYEPLEDGAFRATIPPCVGVIAFGKSLHKCDEELRVALEDWLLAGLKLGQHIPPINGIDLNAEPKREPVDAV